MEKLGHSLEKIMTNISGFFTHHLHNVVLVILAFVLAYVFELLFRQILKALKVDDWFEKAGTQRLLRVLNIKIKPYKIVGKIIFWVTFIVLLLMISYVNEWELITSNLKDFFRYVPKIIGGILILYIGKLISNLIKNAVKTILTNSGSKSANALSKIAYYSLLAITFTIAISYFGIDIRIITANFSIILGSLLLSFALAFAFASKNLLKNILSSSYNKKNFDVGQKISINGNEGEIIKITNISVIIKTEEKIQVIPATNFTERVVEILG